MLHALAAEQTRERFGGFTVPATAASIHLRRGARAPQDLAGSRSHIRYSAPKPADRPTVDFDRVGRVSVHVFEEMGVPPDADFYICGPAAFMSGLVNGLAGWGVVRDRLHTENFGSGQSMTPGIAAVSRRPPHPPGKPRRSGRLYPLRAAISLSTGVPHSTACSN